MTTRLAPFRYRQPNTLDEVFRFVDEERKSDRRFVFAGGGTDVIPLLKHQLHAPDTMISLSGLPELITIEVRPEQKLRIGSMVRISELVKHPTILELAPALAATAATIASPQVRNQATLGGNILVNNRCLYFNQSEHNRISHASCFKADGETCHVVKSAKRGEMPLCRARFVSDTVPVLLLMETELILQSSGTERRIALKDLYLPDGITRNGVQPGEVLSFVDIDTSRPIRICYEKLVSRDSFDFPSLGVAVGVEQENGGKSRLSVALTGVNTNPQVFDFCSDDHDSEAEMTASACQAATRSVVTFQQDQFPRGYRKKMVEVYIRKAIKQLTGDLWI